MYKALCPCGSRHHYEECCGLLHRGKAQASTAEALMRSRYSAFAKHQLDYLINTTCAAQRPLLDQQGIHDWMQQTLWHRLEIIDCVEGQEDDLSGIVEFCASFSLPPAQSIDQHQERSSFIKEGGRWMFVDPTVEVESKGKGKAKTNRNGPCPCGSGKKHKRCCL